MQKTLWSGLIFTLLFLAACSPSTPNLPPAATELPTRISPSETPVPTVTPPPTAADTVTPAPSETATASPIPVVDSLNATVTADLLSCRYGPGSEYLYFFAFKKTAPVKLIGRTDGNSWLLVENEPQRCWVHEKFLAIDGDWKTLKIMYPVEDGYKLPVSPYYYPTTVLHAVRKEGSQLTVDWVHVPVSPGDYEDADMFQYIIEVWRCENGQLIFDPLASNLPFITFVDEPGCTAPSHGRVFVQDKHGYALPAEIPWPPQP